MADPHLVLVGIDWGVSYCTPKPCNRTRLREKRTLQYTNI